MFWPHLDRLLTLIRPRREVLALAIDAFVIAACWHVTYLFRLGFERWHSARPPYDVWVMLALVALYMAVFLALRVPKGMWRFSGFGEVQRLTLACAIAGLVGAVAVLMAQLSQVPRAVLALHPVVSLMGLSMVRIGYRMLYEHMRGRISGSATETRRALVMGAGDAARLLIAGIQHHGWVVVGLLDDDRAKQGARVSNVPVLGPLDSAPRWAAVHGISHIVVAMPSVQPAERRRALDLAAATHLPVVTVPTAAELREGQPVARVREIEAEDLLGREPVRLDEGGISEALSGKVVLITGAGGSIGSEISRQIAACGCSHLTLLDSSEAALFRISREIEEYWPTTSRADVLCDIRDEARLKEVFAAEKPDLVFHAAALKHVPLVEAHPCEGVRTNVFGALNVAEASRVIGATHMAFISTDKAVNPSSVMGATKRLAEALIRQAGGKNSTTRFSIVRFGNVLGSAGSVATVFQQQIERGGPVTVTDEAMERYFMTIPEAVQLVLRAVAMSAARSEPEPGVLTLEMGEPVKIIDLARRMIELQGLIPGADVEIRIIGLRPGEKITEELVDVNEEQRMRAPGVIEAAPRLPPPPIEAEDLAYLRALAMSGDELGVRTALFALIERIRSGVEAPTADNVTPLRRPRQP